MIGLSEDCTDANEREGNGVKSRQDQRLVVGVFIAAGVTTAVAEVTEA